VSDSQTDMTKAERWAASQAARIGGYSVAALVVSIVPLAILARQDSGFLWLIVPFWILAALRLWEGIGFKRLLARRDAEIERLRSEVGSD
jgi:hypothetical protein